MTSEQEERLLDRIERLEELAKDIVTVINKTTTASTISKIVTVFETELTDIKSRLTNLETRVTELEDDPYGEID